MRMRWLSSRVRPLRQSTQQNDLLASAGCTAALRCRSDSSYSLHTSSSSLLASRPFPRPRASGCLPVGVSQEGKSMKRSQGLLVAAGIVGMVSLGITASAQEAFLPGGLDTAGVDRIVPDTPVFVDA